jgi:hypothetical protein
MVLWGRSRVFHWVIAAGRLHVRSEFNDVRRAWNPDRAYAFSVRKLALAEVDRLEVRLRMTRGGIAYRELVVMDQGGVRRASILADDFSDSRIAHFAKAAGLRFKAH